PQLWMRAQPTRVRVGRALGASVLRGFAAPLLRLYSTEQLPERVHDAVVSFTQQRREDVLADLLAPQMVAAVASRVRGGVEIHPVIVLPAGDVIAAVTHPLSMQQETPPQPLQIDATSGVDVDLRFPHRPAPNPRD